MAVTNQFGARVARVEDPRLLRGQTNYIEGMTLPGALEVAFLRSADAHARILRIDASKALGLPGVHRVLLGSDLARIARPIRVDWDTRFTYQACDYPAIATDKVRFVGEILAAVVADDRYLAEDALELIEVETEALPAVTTLEQALAPDAPRIHAEFEDNVVYRAAIGKPESVNEAFKSADAVVSARYQMNRHCACPMEGKAVLAVPDPISKELSLYSSTQMPHMVQAKLAEYLGIPETRLRVIAPDVGGGFGLKCHIQPEEIALSALGLELGRPVRWVEDRRENLIGGFHAKEEQVSVELALQSDGVLLGMKVAFVSDAGAYTGFPWSPAAEPSMAMGAAQGSYRIPAVRSEAMAVATNKSTSSVYRGVGVPAAMFALEHTLDLAADRLGLDPADIRRKNMLRSADFPFRTRTGYHYDSGTPLESMEKALEMIDYAEFRKQQREARAQGRYLGIGIGAMMEITTFGHDTMALTGQNQNISAYESAQVQVGSDGSIVVRVGTLSHGQAHRTTFAQLVTSVLGCALEDVQIVQGDTSRTPYGWGTWGSRSAVAGGGALLAATQRVREKVVRCGAHLLEVSADDVDFKDGVLAVRRAPSRSLTLKQIARAVVYEGRVPEDDEPSLRADFSFKAPTPFTNATHAAVVEVDPELGSIQVQRYVVVEDCGKMINPMVVEGQIHGGVAQGLGSVLLEEHRYDESGQLLTASLMDYLVPTASDVPPIQIGHLESPSPWTIGGMKGMGEGGAVAPIPAVANAVSDALRPLCGWKSMDVHPIKPERVVDLIRAGESLP